MTIMLTLDLGLTPKNHRVCHFCFLLINTKLTFKHWCFLVRIGQIQRLTLYSLRRSNSIRTVGKKCLRYIYKDTFLIVFALVS